MNIWLIESLSLSVALQAISILISVRYPDNYPIHLNNIVMGLN